MTLKHLYRILVSEISFMGLETVYGISDRGVRGLNKTTGKLHFITRHRHAKLIAPRPSINITCKLLQLNRNQ
jgi:hypothetical protein